MKITAKLISLGDMTEGTNKQGNAWRKAVAVVETMEQYPKKIAIDFFNAALEAVKMQPMGSVLDIEIEINSREYNGKWYTSVSGRGFEPHPMQAQQQAHRQEVPNFDNADGDGDLPF